MAPREPSNAPPPSPVGVGWSFPPAFSRAGGGVAMTTDAEDVEASLRILFSTQAGERILDQRYGLDLQAYLFESPSTSLLTELKERIRVAIAIYEPRIDVVSLALDDSRRQAGELRILLEYAIRATNSRFNLVFPFYQSDANELRATASRGRAGS
jgi:phage baseplate assembly protein W